MSDLPHNTSESDTDTAPRIVPVPLSPVSPRPAAAAALLTVSIPLSPVAAAADAPEDVVPSDPDDDDNGDPVFGDDDSLL